MSSRNEKCKIIVPVIGFVNAGKSTLIDALLQGEYTQMSSCACTKCIFRFVIDESSSSPTTTTTTTTTTRRIGGVRGNAESTSAIQSVPEINQRIQEMNHSHDVFPGKHFEASFRIQLKVPLCTEMMDNTEIEFVDLPGIAENLDCGTKDYIQRNWCEFGCVLVVMDISRSSDEERRRNKNILSYLRTIKDGKDVPILVVGNKKDLDPDEQATDTLQQDVESFFDSNFRFVAVSAKQILYFRVAQDLDLELFQQHYQSKINAIAKIIYKPHEKNLAVLLDALKDNENIKSAMKESNFDELLVALKGEINGVDNQKKIVKRGLVFQLNTIVDLDGVIPIAKSLYDIHVPFQELVISKLEDMFKSELKVVKDQFRQTYAEKSQFVRLMGEELVKVTSGIPWEDEDVWWNALLDMRYKAVRYYFQTIRWQYNRFKIRRSRNTNDYLNTSSNSPGDDFRYYSPSVVPSSSSKKRRKSGKTTTATVATAAASTNAAALWENLTIYEWKMIFRTMYKQTPNFDYHFPTMGYYIDMALQSKEMCCILDEEYRDQQDMSAHDLSDTDTEPGEVSSFHQKLVTPTRDSSSRQQSSFKVASLSSNEKDNVHCSSHWGHVPMIWIETTKYTPLVQYPL